MSSPLKMKNLLDEGDSDTASSSPDRLQRDSGRCEKPVSSQGVEKVPVLPCCDHPQSMSTWCRECRERFPRHPRLAIPTCITAGAWRTCRAACRDRWLAVSFEVGGRENVPGIPDACATHKKDFGEDTLWQHSCVPRYIPRKTTTHKTWQPNKKFKNCRWGIGWYDCHFAFRVQFPHTDSTQPNMICTIAILPLAQLEKSVLMAYTLTGTGQTWWSAVEPCHLKRVTRGLLYIVRGLLLNIIWICTKCDAQRTHW